MYVRFQVRYDSFELNVEATLPDTGVIGVCGRSGSGKTTLLRCIAGLQFTKGGVLEVGGRTWQGAGTFLPAYGRPIGYVFQEPRLFPHLTVEENLAFGFRRTSPAGRKLTMNHIIEMLQLQALLRRHPHQLSGGQAGRVSLGRALCTSPELLLLDEPLSSLDETSKNEIFPFIERVCADLALPILYVSHSVDEIGRLADHLIFLDGGAVAAGGPTQDVLTARQLAASWGEALSSVIQATVVRNDPQWSLTHLEFSGGRLVLPALTQPVGARVKIRIPARDVVIAREATQLSSLNVLEGRLLETVPGAHPGEVLLRIRVGSDTIVASITRFSEQKLELRPGCSLVANVKALALS